jgi:hypothetical protein
VINVDVHPSPPPAPIILRVKHVPTIDDTKPGN